MNASEMLLHANHLDNLQKVENNGRGVSCIRSIVHYLRREDWQSARSTYFNERDKTRQYHKLVKTLIEIFGLNP